MTKIRVLVVDDSVVVRRVLTDAIGSDPALEVVGAAATGQIALQKIPQVSPDVVVLDVEMPDMDGLETVKRIRASWPKLPVIMCSSLTERGAETTLKALSNGASDCIAKPSALAAAAGFQSELRAKIRALGGRNEASPPVSARPQLVTPRLRTLVKPSISVIAIGCSTGGPNALSSVFATLPKDLGVPIFITQHMPPLFTKMLAERLASSTGLSVVEAKHGDIVQPDRTYIAPGDFHLTVTADLRISLHQGVPENSCRPAVDPMFRSLAQVYGGGVLALVMTGMGHDGMRGARSVVDAGGTVIVQDAETSVVPSMPGAVLSAGLADGVYPLDRIGLELVARVRRSRRAAAFMEARA